MSQELMTFLTAWSFDPGIVASLLLGVGLYAIGWRRLQRRGQGQTGPARWRVWCFASAMLLLALALLSPIDVYSDRLFSLHMTQHLLMLMIIPPLLWMGEPLLPTLWGMPRTSRRWVGQFFVASHPVARVGHLLTHPLVAGLLYLGSMAIWHLPFMYDAAQGRALVHNLEHIAFFGGGLIFWWPVIQPNGARRLSYWMSLPYLAVPMLEGNLIGAIISLAGQPLYMTYEQAPRVLGVSVMDDQQIAGLLMWVIAGMLWLVPMSIMFMLAGKRDAHESDIDLEAVGQPLD